MRRRLKTYLFLFFIEFVALGGIAFHGDEQISKGVLEDLPILEGVEKFDNEGLNLDAVHVGELAQQSAGEIVAHKVSIGWKSMWLTLFGVEFGLLVDNLTIDIDGTE